MEETSGITNNKNDHTQAKDQDIPEHSINVNGTENNITLNNDQGTRCNTLTHHKGNDASSKHSISMASAPESPSYLKDCENGTCDDKEPPSTHPLLSTSAGEETEQDLHKEQAISAVTDNPHPPGLPVDRGWAWVIMMAQFTITLLMVGYGRALSMFFLEFIDMFDVSVSSATIALGIMTAFFGFGNMMVSHFLMSRFTTRKIVLTGAMINATFIAISALAPNMLFVTVTHSFIGFSHALMFVPGTTLLGHYFNRRRSFAMAVASTGLSVSALIFPPLTQLLISSFGARGALLLVAGIELHCLVAASMLRPISFYVRRKPKTEVEQTPPRMGHHVEETLNNQNMKISNGLSQKNGYSVGEEEDTTVSPTQRLDKFKYHQDTDMGTSLQDSSTTPHVILSTSLPEKSFLSSQLDHCSSEEVLNRHKQHTSAQYRVFARQQSCPMDHTHQRNRQDKQVSQSLSSLKRFSALTLSVVDVCGSTMNIATDELFTSMSINHKGDFQKDLYEDDSDSTKKGDGCGRCASVMSSIIDLSLFKNWLFLLIVTYVPLGFSAGFIGFYFPSLGVGNGLSRPDAALLLTVVGGVDMVSRLVVGYVADLNLVKRTHIVAVSMTIMGFASQFCSLYTSFSLLAMFAVIYGLVGGVCNSLFSVVIIDLLGLGLLGKAMALVLLVNSAYASLTHVLIGGLVDVSGSFVISFNYVGACLFASAIILLTEPLARRLEARRMKKT